MQWMAKHAMVQDGVQYRAAGRANPVFGAMIRGLFRRAIKLSWFVVIG